MEAIKKTKNKSIIFAGFAFIFALFVVAVCYFNVALRDMVKQNTNMFLQETASHQASLFYEKINEQLNILEIVENNFSDVDFDDYNQVKETICSTNGIGEFKTISIADDTGSAIFNTNKMAGNISHTEYYKDAMSGKASVSDSVLVDDEGDDILAFSVPVYRGSEVKGVLTGSLDRDVLTSLFDRKIFDGLGYVYVVNSEGDIIVAGSNKDAIRYEDNILDFLQKSNGGDDSSYSKFEDGLKSGSSGIMYYTVEGMERYAAYQPVGIYDWYVVTVITDEVINNQSKNIGIMVSVFMLCVVLLFLGLLITFIFIMKKNSESNEFTDNEMLPQKKMHTDNSEIYKMLDFGDDMDKLTGVNNKNKFVSLVKNHFESENSSKLGAFFILDMANLGEINDRLGHSFGDALLARTVLKVQKIFYEDDFIGRVGGDEFAVFMIVDNDFGEERFRELAEKKAKQVCKSVKDITYKIDKKQVSLSVTVGVALSPRDGSDYIRLYSHADNALELAKNTNKGGYIFY